jgi:serine protease DegS
MNLHRLLSFIASSTIAGLAVALLLLLVIPGFFNHEQLQVQEAPAYPSLPASGPVSYADAVSRAAPSVVNIYTTKITTQRVHPFLNDPLLQNLFGNALSQTLKKRENSLGSGVIVDESGYILTNNHVIEGADEIRVVLATGQTLQAKIVGADPETDLAVLKASNFKLPAISIARSSSLRVGDVVLAIGNPFGVGQTVTQGIVSATGRSQLGINTFENFIQTDAAINPGNSGGALINAYGDLIGINTAIFSKNGGSMGIGFAIPADLARGVMQQIVESGYVSRGWLGIAGQDVTPELAEAYALFEKQGVMISGLLENGPADKAGLQPGDIITRIDDQPLTSSFEILNIIASKRPGTRVSIKAKRGRQDMDLVATVEQRPQTGN